MISDTPHYIVKDGFYYAWNNSMLDYEYAWWLYLPVDMPHKKRIDAENILRSVPFQRDCWDRFGGSVGAGTNIIIDAIEAEDADNRE